MDTVQSFERGLAVIRSFGASTPRQTLSDVSRTTGLSRATARRLLQTLEANGYARRLEDNGHFELTPRILDLGYAYLASHSLAELAAPHLEELSRRVRESSSVAVLDGPDVVYVARVQANRVMTVSIGIGSRFPAYRTSLGRALLAWRDPEVVRCAWDDADHDGPTSTTVSDIDGLHEALSQVRRDGWALVDQELEVGVRSVAAPVRDGSEAVVAAVNVSTHTSRTSRTELRRTVVPVLLETAAGISAALTDNRV